MEEVVCQQVPEDAGRVEVCAVILSPNNTTCPVDFQVTVTMSTSAGTAGTVYTTYNCVFLFNLSLSLMAGKQYLQ